MEPNEKRKKIMKAERLNEMENLSDIIKSNNNDQVAIKQKRPEKAKSINNFALCDQLSGAIKALLVEKGQLRVTNHCTKEKRSHR